MTHCYIKAYLVIDHIRWYIYTAVSLCSGLFLSVDSVWRHLLMAASEQEAAEL